MVIAFKDTLSYEPSEGHHVDCLEIVGSATYQDLPIHKLGDMEQLWARGESVST